MAAPSGSKWLYRINPDDRRCWFLSSRAIGGHHTQSRRAASVRRRHLAGDADALGQDQRRDNDLQAASPLIGKTDVALPKGVGVTGEMAAPNRGGATRLSMMAASSPGA